jgi:hypothetical protein
MSSTYPVVNSFCGHLEARLNTGSVSNRFAGGSLGERAGNGEGSGLGPLRGLGHVWGLSTGPQEADFTGTTADTDTVWPVGFDPKVAGVIFE